MTSQQPKGQSSHSQSIEENAIPSNVIAQAEAAIQGHLDEDKPALKKSKTHQGGGETPGKFTA